MCVVFTAVAISGFARTAQTPLTTSKITWPHHKTLTLKLLGRGSWSAEGCALENVQKYAAKPPLKASKPEQSPYISIYVCIYIYIYPHVAEPLFQHPKGRTRQENPASTKSKVREGQGFREKGFKDSVWRDQELEI